MDGDPVTRLTQLADPGCQPRDELAAPPRRPLSVNKTGVFLAAQWDAAEPGGEHRARGCALGRFETSSFPVRGLDGCFVAAAHYPGWAAVFGGQGREHRPFHNVAELVEPVDVSGHLVVLDVASILRSVGGDDVVVAGADQVVADQGFALLALIGPASGVDGLRWHAQGDVAVDGTAALGVPGVGLSGPDVVAEEPCRAGAGVGDQGLLGGEFQLQLGA